MLARVVDGFPRAISQEHPHYIRPGETLESLLHALDFRRDFNQPHFVYKRKIQALVKRWNGALHNAVTDMVLERADTLETGIEDECAQQAVEHARNLRNKRIMQTIERRKLGAQQAAWISSAPDRPHKYDDPHRGSW